MAESSIFWATNGTGDGAAIYTQAQTRQWLQRTFIRNTANEGVIAGYANNLAVSGTASPLSVATGAAMVYGFPYENTSIVSVTIPTPSASTRIDRVILRVDWVAQTVRIARIAGVEGGSAPALTQVANTTWEISLAQVAITTGGVCTVTNERRPVARLAAVHRRQGGSATDWNNPGTTDRFLGNTSTQVGMDVWLGAPSTSGAINIVYTDTFTSAPLVFLTGNANSGIKISTSITSISATGCTLQWYSVSGATETSVGLYWMAIGPVA